MSQYPLKVEGKFKYSESSTDKKETILLLHGLMGGLSNFTELIEYFAADYNVVFPIIPIYDAPMLSVSVQGFVDYIVEFINYKGYSKVHLCGNSLGGHVGLLTTLKEQDRVATLTLTGSSGLYESAMGSTFPRRGDFDYIKKKTEEVFFDPAIATEELVKEIFETVNDRGKAIRIVATSKSAIRHNLSDKLHLIKIPVLLIWGKHDSVTPPFVAEKFNELIENSRLVWIDKCGHAPMMEHPAEFNAVYGSFLKEVLG